MVYKDFVAAVDQQNPTPEKRKRHRWERAFLSALAVAGNVSAACRAAKVDRTVAYGLRGECPEFAAEWQQALDEAADDLEAEATRRAREGVRRLKFHKGELVRLALADEEGRPVLDGDGQPVMVPYVEHEYSDTLLIFLLKAHRPERFRERLSLEHSGDGGGPIRFVEVVGEEGPGGTDG